jgi:bacteriocin biosynthesis cyclodehydratase domain-containing protein
MQVQVIGRPGADVPGRPRLVAGWELRLTADGDLFLLRELGEGDLLVEGEGAYVAELLRGADGTRTAEEVACRAGGTGSEDPLECLAELARLGVLEDAALDTPGLDAHSAERFDRQLAYFSQRLPAGVTRTDPQLRLQRARVCVLGMGGLGSWTALALATCGVGTIVGVDCDAVELSNLNRQVLYAEHDIGHSKAQAAGRLLRAYDSRLDYVPVVARMEGVDDVLGVIDGADAVVAAADWPPHLIDRWVSEACFALGVPYIAMSQQPPVVRVGPLYVPGETGCYACQEEAFRQSHPDYDVLVDTTSPFATTATFGPACAVTGGMAAFDVVHVVAGLDTPMTRGRALFVDLSTGETRGEEVVRVAGCPRCSDQCSR